MSAKKYNKIFRVILSLFLILTMAPVHVYADDEVTPEEVVLEESEISEELVLEESFEEPEEIIEEVNDPFELEQQEEVIGEESSNDEEEIVVEEALEESEEVFEEEIVEGVVEESVEEVEVPLEVMEDSEPLEYLDYWEDKTTEYKTLEQGEYSVFPNINGGTISDGVYFVDRDILLTERLVVNGTVKIILGDGFTLTCQRGITVNGSNTLYIYGQRGKTGKLIASPYVSAADAGIGGESLQSCGTIHICGGIVEATGGSAGGAGIGGGAKGDNGNITIHGGKVTATGGAQYGAGIGGGDEGYGGTVTIWDGEVYAKGGEFGAGIGSGDQPNNSNIMTINIFGGHVEATGGDEAAGIGGGNEGNGATVNIRKAKKNPTVIANGGNDDVGEGAGIGGGDEGDGGTVTIDGGYVEARGGYRAAGIGGGADGSNTKVFINGGEVYAYGGGVANIGTRQSGGAGIGGGAYGYGGVIMIRGGGVDAHGYWGGAGLGGGYGKGATSIFITDGAVRAEGVNGGAAIGSGYGGDVANIGISGGSVYALVKSPGAAGAGAAIGSGNGGYVANLTISGGTIEARSEFGNNGAAAIGGGNEGYFGNINIEGGTITTAYTYNGGAGIGTGAGAEKRSDQAVAKITISGGTIKTTSYGEYTNTSLGAGIGTGAHAKSPVHIEISGGNIKAESKLDEPNRTPSYPGAGIGTGYDSPIGTITITGGTIYASRPHRATKADPIGFYNDAQNSVYPNIIFNYDEAQIRSEKGEGTDKRVTNTQYDSDPSLSRRLALLENDSDWVEIKPCDHVEKDFEIVSPGEEGTHKIHCEYCLASEGEEHVHEFNNQNQCECGYYRYRLTFTDGQEGGQKKEDYLYPYLLSDGSGVDPVVSFRVKEHAPTYVIAGKKFTGWKIEGDTSDRIYQGDDYVQSITKDTTLVAQWSDLVGVTVVLSSIDGSLDQISLGELAGTTRISDVWNMAVTAGLNDLAAEQTGYVLSTERGSKPLDEVSSMTEFNNLSQYYNTVSDLEDSMLYVAMLKVVDDVAIDITVPMCGTKIETTYEAPLNIHGQSPRPELSLVNDGYETNTDKNKWVTNSTDTWYPSAGVVTVVGGNTYYLNATVTAKYGYAFVDGTTNITLNDEASVIDGTIDLDKNNLMFNAGIKAEHDFGEWEVDTPATCASEGVEKRICQADGCEAFETRPIEIDPDAHDYADPKYTWLDDNREVTAEMVCRHSDEHNIVETVKTSASVVKEATCTEKGKTKYTAVFQNDAFTLQTKTVEDIDALDHDWSEWETKEPTCTQDGEKKHVCSRCGEVESEVLKALGHDYGAWTVTKEPTETEEGEETHVCSRDSSHIETRPIPKIVSITYMNTEGDGLVWTKGSSVPAVFTFKRSVDDQETYEHFNGIQVDGKEVDPSNYDAKSGSVVVSLKPSYLEILTLGEHTLTTVFEDGNDPTVKFTVVEEKKDDKKDQSPDTGVESKMVMWEGLLVVSLVGYAVVSSQKKKKEDNE